MFLQFFACAKKLLAYLKYFSPVMRLHAHVLRTIICVVLVLIMSAAARVRRKKPIVRTLLKAGYVVLTEKSCKFSIGKRAEVVVDANRHLIGVNEPRSISHFMNVMKVPDALCKFAQRCPKPFAELIVGLNNGRVRKLYVTQSNRLTIRAIEMSASGKLVECTYADRRQIDVSSVNLRAARVFWKWDGSRGHMRYDDHGKLVAVHLRIAHNEKVIDFVPYIQAWLGVNLAKCARTWVTDNSTRVVSYVSFTFNPPTCTLYHSAKTERAMCD